MFSYAREPETWSPFVLLDYIGPMEFEPTNDRRGVGAHPHRGFETVTILHAGRSSIATRRAPRRHRTRRCSG
jgi:hypothetical protein